MKTSQALRIVLLSIVLGCGGPAFSQSSTGSISGTVTDQNGAVISGADVELRKLATLRKKFLDDGFKKIRIDVRSH